jgi:hypothetical protein
MPLDLIPGWLPVSQMAYAQIEFGTLFQQIRAKPRETLAAAMMSSANTPFI